MRYYRFTENAKADISNEIIDKLYCNEWKKVENKKGEKT
jgi:hypothetical protein